MKRAAIAIAAPAVVVCALCTLAPVRALGHDTFASTVGGLVNHCGGGYDLGRVDWIAAARARGEVIYFAQPAQDGELVAPTGPLPNLLGALAMAGIDGEVVAMDELRWRARLVADLLLAAAIALLVWAARPREQPWRAAAVGLVAGLSFAGAPTLGAALWQQTISLVPLIAGFALIARRDDVPRLAIAAPALVAVAAMIRPTIGPLAIGLCVWWAIGAPRRTWVIAAALALVALAPLAWWSDAHYGTPLPLGQWRSNTSNTSGAVFALGWEGAAGLFVSPARGLLWFAPIALVGIVRAPRWLRVALIAELAVMACFYMWWGGICFGPRFAGEVVWLATWAALATPVGTRAARIAVIACAALTVAVGLLAIARDPMKWELARDVDHDRAARWDFADGPLTALVAHRYADVVVEEHPVGDYRCVGDRVELVPR